jgi:peptide/nickel transport system ATP-binding protein
MVDIALRIRNLRVNFYTYDGVVQAIDGVDLELRRGETLGLVGETGCGKSVTVQSIIRLIPEPPGRVEAGEAFLDMPEEDWGRILELEAQLKRYLPLIYGTDDAMEPLDLGRLRTLRGSLQRWMTTTVEDARRAGVSGGNTMGNGGQAVEAVPLSSERAMEIQREASNILPIVNELVQLKERYDILWKTPEELRRIRGNRIAMIFQEPGAALNPVLSVGRQVGETFLIHRHEEVCDAALRELDQAIRRAQKDARRLLVPLYTLQRRLLGLYRRNPKSRILSVVDRVPGLKRWRRWLDAEVRRRVVEMLNSVRIPNPEKVVDQYPHELSGGMQQRVLIAMSLAANPDILIADEPTTALDVTIQAQILKLMQTLKEQYQSSIIFITHDLAVIAQVCDRVSVMYAGTICEVGDVREIFKNPLHPYTQGLVRAVPRPDADVPKLEEIPGTVPNLIYPPSGCRFHPRCPFAKEYCKEVKPTLMEAKERHLVACHIYGPEGHLWGEQR